MLYTMHVYYMPSKSQMNYWCPLTTDSCWCMLPIVLSFHKEIFFFFLLNNPGCAHLLLETILACVLF